MVNGKKIKKLREDAQLTTFELAEMVYTSQAMISSVELGIKSPSVALLKRIADKFGVIVDDLLVEEITNK